MTSNQNKYLFTVTHFDGDADRVAAPLVLANNALAAAGDVVVWVTLEGVMLAKQGAADGVIPKSFPPVADLLKVFKENGGRIGVCPPCGKTHGVTSENILPKAEWMGASAVLLEGQGRQVFSF